jgi:hypothetical protein
VDRPPAESDLTDCVRCGPVEQTLSRGAAPDFYTAGARWKREADIPDDIYFRALEALG